MKNGAKASDARVTGGKANAVSRHAIRPNDARMTEGRESGDLASNLNRYQSCATAHETFAFAGW